MAEDITPSFIIDESMLKTPEDICKALTMMGFQRGNWQKLINPEELEPFVQAIKALIMEARISENQIPLDKIINYKPDPNAPSFGSASGAIETAGWKQYFERRIDDIRSGK